MKYKKHLFKLVSFVLLNAFLVSLSVVVYQSLQKLKEFQIKYEWKVQKKDILNEDLENSFFFEEDNERLETENTFILSFYSVILLGSVLLFINCVINRYFLHQKFLVQSSFNKVFLEVRCLRN
ncbi:MAG TPA: hypothetical protein PK995_03685 [Bacteroidia bacterium]|nr:hypothetical protein [Bacteroidia bacterium]